MSSCERVHAERERKNICEYCGSFDYKNFVSGKIKMKVLTWNPGEEEKFLDYIPLDYSSFLI